MFQSLQRYLGSVSFVMSALMKLAYQKGMFVATIQMCSHCKHQWLWKSQPCIKDTPARNLLFSAAILFSGATSGKILL